MKAKKKRRGENSTRMSTQERHTRFAQEWCVDFNATQAAIRAGYSENGASQTGNKLLSCAQVQEEIKRCQDRARDRAESDADRVIRELKNVGFQTAGDIADFTGKNWRLKAPKDVPAQAQASISSIKTKRYTRGAGKKARTVDEIEVKRWDKVRALIALAQHFGLLDKDEIPPGAKKDDTGGELTNEQRLARLAVLIDVSIRTREVAEGAEAGATGRGGPAAGDNSGAAVAPVSGAANAGVAQSGV